MKRKKAAPAILPLAAVKAGAVLALALAAAWLPGARGAGGRPTRVWRGYETLLLRTDALKHEAVASMVKSFGTGVVSDLTATVSFWNFTGVESVPVNRIDARIDPSDPRHDKVLDVLSAYFRASSVERQSVVYIPSRRAALFDYLKIASLLGLPRHGSWRLLEFEPAELILSAACLLGLAVLLGYPQGKEGREGLVVAIAGAVLWIPFLVPGGVARLALALLLLTAWIPVAEVAVALHGWDDKLLAEARDPLLGYCATTAAGLVLLLPAGGFSAAAFIGSAGTAAASVLLLGALALLWGRVRRPRRRRKKFEPVPIVKRSGSSSRRGMAGFLLAFGSFVIVAIIEVLRSTPVPTPLPVFGVRNYTWESLSRLNSDGREPRLPDVSDIVAHDAFQETLAFGRPWGLPHRDERVYLREFSTDPLTGRIAADLRTVKVFDDNWLGAVLRRAPPGSIEGLLLAQRGAVVVAPRGQLRGLLRELPLAILVMVVFSAWFVRERGTAPLMKFVHLRFNGAARRNQVR
jgi:hypothetical protein